MEICLCKILLCQKNYRAECNYNAVGSTVQSSANSMATIAKLLWDFIEGRVSLYAHELLFQLQLILFLTIDIEHLNFNFIFATKY